MTSLQFSPRYGDIGIQHPFNDDSRWFIREFIITPGITPGIYNIVRYGKERYNEMNVKITEALKKEFSMEHNHLFVDNFGGLFHSSDLIHLAVSRRSTGPLTNRQIDDIKVASIYLNYSNTRCRDIVYELVKQKVDKKAALGNIPKGSITWFSTCVRCNKQHNRGQELCMDEYEEILKVAEIEWYAKFADIVEEIRKEAYLGITKEVERALNRCWDIEDKIAEVSVRDLTKILEFSVLNSDGCSVPLHNFAKLVMVVQEQQKVIEDLQNKMNKIIRSETNNTEVLADSTTGDSRKPLLTKLMSYITCS